MAYLWPDLDTPRNDHGAEVVHLYPRRADAPRELWRQMVTNAVEIIDIYTYASAFFAEAVPDANALIRSKADEGVTVHINLGDPNSPEAIRRGEDEGINVPGRIREAMAYYAPMVDHPGIEFRSHATILYNSVYRFDNEMLVNQHALGCHGFAAPLLHFRRTADAVLWTTYERFAEHAWSASYTYTG